MTLPVDGWGDTMSPPRAWGAEILTWYENYDVPDRDACDIALRALEALRADTQLVIDALTVMMRAHDRDLPARGLRGDTAMDHPDVADRQYEEYLLDTGNAQVAEDDYWSTVAGPYRHVEAEQARSERDLRGYDGRVFGWRDLDDDRQVDPTYHPPDAPEAD